MIELYSTMMIPTRKFLQLLAQGNVIAEGDIEKLELASLKENKPIDEYLLTVAHIDKTELLKAKSSLLSVPWVDAVTVPIVPQAVNLVNDSTAKQYKVMPFDIDEKTNSVKLAMADPFDIEVIDFIQKKTGKRIEAYLANPEDLDKAIDLAYSQGLSPDITEALKDVAPEVNTVTTEDLGKIIKEAPVAKIVTTILEYAVKGRASDIHIEAQETKTRVRYRIDGILQEKLVLPKGIHEALVSRIKIVSGLKIDEKRVPQDGRFNFKIGEEEVDLRVSTLPTVHGEKVVMRLLKKTGGIPTLNDLGMRGPQLASLEEAILKPYGIILVTGPTGSGKSTTLYSVLNRLNKPGVNIVTLEDPVEYQIAGINQVQVNTGAGLTFATGLRAFLRQDPNIILVGEVRDTETTQLALQAALTGHLVFSTLHTNDAATSIPRLLDLGGESFLIASVLNAVVGQRICRKLCASCKKQYPAPIEVMQNIRENLGDLLPVQYKDQNSQMTLYKNEGCSECNNTGYLGRIGIYEVLKISNAINKLIIQQATARDIERTAMDEGMIRMKQDGFLKALDGVTTLEEVLRVAEV